LIPEVISAVDPEVNHSSGTLRAWGAVGGFAISKTSDIFGEWDYDYKLAGYNATVQLVGGKTLTVARRERPKVLLEDGVPTVLTNGVCLNRDDENCFTLAQRILSMKLDDADDADDANTIDQTAAPLLWPLPQSYSHGSVHKDRCY